MTDADLESKSTEDLIKEYEKHCDKHLKNILYPHEPLLMNYKPQIISAIKQVKKISWEIYNKKKKIHKSNGKKGFYAEIEVSIDNHIGKICYSIKSYDISKMSKSKIKKKIDKIKTYKDGHPEKCYLHKLEKEYEKIRIPNNCFNL